MLSEIAARVRSRKKSGSSAGLTPNLEDGQRQRQETVLSHDGDGVVCIEPSLDSEQMPVRDLEKIAEDD